MSRSKCYLLSLSSALLILLLGACAPGVRGVSAGYPLEVGLRDAAPVAAGQTWYVESAFDPEVFGFDRNELDQRLLGDMAHNPHATEKNRDRVTNLIDVEASRLPDGWGVDLARATLVREVVDVDSQYYYFRDSLELVFAVTIPAGMAPGWYTAMLTVGGRDGEERPLILRFDVNQPATEDVSG